MIQHFIPILFNTLKKCLLHNGRNYRYNKIFLFSGKDFDYSTFKRGLPYVYVYDHKDWKSVKKKIRPNYVEAFIDKLNKLITDSEIDVMVFDFLETKVGVCEIRKLCHKSLMLFY